MMKMNKKQARSSMARGQGTRSPNKWVHTSVAAACVAMAAACSSSEATGDLSMLLEPEDTIRNGLKAGDGLNNLRDGWSASFSKYLLSVGDIRLRFASDNSQEAMSEESWLVDLKQLPQNGKPLWSFEGLRAGRWELYYKTGHNVEGAEADDTVDDADATTMRGADLTYLVEGTLEKADGVSCPPPALVEAGAAANATVASNNDDPDAATCYENAEISFRFEIPAETTFGPCEIDGASGFSIPEGGTQAGAISIHGDHMFFNGFPEGEDTVRRQAQWLADSDLNLDGVVTKDELEQIQATDLPVVASYSLSGAPISVVTMWDFLVAQMKTQGHYQGEGECAIDGVFHEHNHDHGGDDHDHGDDDHDHDEDDHDHDEDDHDHDEDDHDHS